MSERRQPLHNGLGLLHSSRGSRSRPSFLFDDDDDDDGKVGGSFDRVETSSRFFAFVAGHPNPSPEGLIDAMPSVPHNTNSSSNRRRGVLQRTSYGLWLTAFACLLEGGPTFEGG
jgi:hypothetical protein